MKTYSVINSMYVFAFCNVSYKCILYEPVKSVSIFGETYVYIYIYSYLYAINYVIYQQSSNGQMAC